jgi:hypothetical protein
MIGTSPPQCVAEARSPNLVWIVHHAASFSVSATFLTLAWYLNDR